MAESPALLSWRRAQPKGAIMRPETFASIERSASAHGADNPQRVAGAAYWRTAERKFQGRRSTRRNGRP